MNNINPNNDVANNVTDEKAQQERNNKNAI